MRFYQDERRERERERGETSSFVNRALPVPLNSSRLPLFERERERFLIFSPCLTRSKRSGLKELLSTSQRNRKRARGRVGEREREV